MEISVERHHHAVFEGGSPDNLCIFRLGQTGFASVNRIQTRLTEQAGCRTRGSLVEQQFHPAGASSITLSSRLAAA